MVFHEFKSSTWPWCFPITETWCTKVTVHVYQSIIWTATTCSSQTNSWLSGSMKYCSSMDAWHWQNLKWKCRSFTTNHGRLQLFVWWHTSLEGKSYFSEQYDAHNAITDVAALRGLVEIIDVCHEAVESSIFSANTVKNMMVFDAQKSRNYETLKELMTSGLLTKCMG